MIFTDLETSHLSGGLRMSRQVNWPHRLKDWALVAGISKGSVALDEERVVATALATPFGDVGMVNLIIVDAALRGQGLGRKIMSRAMDQIAPAIWRLIATKEGLPMYEKFGFEARGEILQHQGVVAPIAPTGSAHWAEPDNLDEICALDMAASGMDRRPLYRALSETARFVFINGDTGITGFAVVRSFGKGKVIGPVVAENLSDARDMMSKIMHEYEGQFLRIDTDADSGIAAWVSDYGLTHAGGGIQMQRGSGAGVPSGPHRVFTLASQALG